MIPGHPELLAPLGSHLAAFLVLEDAKFGGPIR
jgi:hypothetical protein